MARPKKSIVEYFSHDSTPDIVVSILEKRWGNDGYAVWYKLRETLGRSDNHFVDCRNRAAVICICSTLGVNEQVFEDIMNLLAELQAIDPELWNSKIIFSAEFVKRLTDVYERRKVLPPTREVVIQITGVELMSTETGLMDTETQVSGDSVNNNRQSKVKESKVKEIKEDDTREEPEAEAQTKGQQQSNVWFQLLTEKRAYFENRFPNIDLDLSVNKLSFHQQGRPIPVDPFLRLFNWLQNEREDADLKRARLNQKRMAERY